MNMIMCGNDIFANVYMRLYWVRALNTRTSTLIRKKRFGQSQICRTKTTILRQKQTWSDVSENQGTRITSYQKLSLVQFSFSVVSNSLQPHESQHARPPCPSPTPGVYSNSCPSSWWCHPAISSSVVPFSSCPQLLPVPGPFPMSQLFSWGGQSIGVSASASVLPVNTQDLSPLGCTGWISLQSKGLSRVFSNTTVQKHQFFGAQFSSQSNSHQRQGGSKEPLDESERGEWKSWLKTEHSEN